jgi:carbon storage regulator CsrA
MLVVTRKRGESIYVLPRGCKEDEAIEVVVTRTRLGSCSLGVRAPKDVKILRDDVVKKQQEQLARCE